MRLFALKSIHKLNLEQGSLYHTWVRMFQEQTLVLIWCPSRVRPWSLSGQQRFRGGKNLTQNDHIYTWLCCEFPWLYCSLYKPWLRGNSDKSRDWELVFFKPWCLQDPSVTPWAEAVSQLRPSPVVVMSLSAARLAGKPNPSMLWARNGNDEPRSTIQKTSATAHVHLASSGALTMNQTQYLGRKQIKRTRMGRSTSSLSPALTYG